MPSRDSNLGVRVLVHKTGKRDGYIRVIGDESMIEL